LRGSSDTGFVPCFRSLAAIVAVLLSALTVPSIAVAAPSHRTVRAKAPRPLSAAAAVAGRYWGAEPCNGKISFLTQRSPTPGLAAKADAWVTFDSALGANNLVAPASSYTNCTMSFSLSRWPTSASMSQDWDIFCATVIHELGHLLGHPHAVTPGSVMAAIFTDYSNVPVACRASRPRR
jgi:hypothetical protein